jgi:hypothetical protein
MYTHTLSLVARIFFMPHVKNKKKKAKFKIGKPNDFDVGYTKPERASLSNNFSLQV